MGATMTESATAVADPLPLARPPAHRAHRFWTTPRWLAALGAVIVLLAVGLGLLVSTTAAGATAGFDVIGHQAAPQVRVSTDLYFALSDLDAQAANVLLVGTGRSWPRTAPPRCASTSSAAPKPTTISTKQRPTPAPTRPPSGPSARPSTSSVTTNP
jgi:hypothetical protein